MQRDAGIAEAAGLAALDGARVTRADLRVLDAGALRSTAEVLNRSDAGVVQPRLDDLLSADEQRTVEEELSRSAAITDRLVEAVQKVAKRRGITLGRPAVLTNELLMGSEPPEAALARLGGTAEDRQALALGTQVADVAKRLLAKIDAEWAGLPKLARSAFENLANHSGIAPDVYYRKIRAMMHVAGWEDPFRFWKEIVPAKLFGVDIEHGVHRELLNKLADVAAGPAGGGRAPIRTVFGFQPRPQQGTDTLTNHAWGLAIDVDARWNPYITKPKVIDVVKAHTSDHVDLARDPIDPNTPDDQKLAMRYAILKKASDEIAAWLGVASPKEQQLAAALKEAQAKLAKARSSRGAAGVAAAEEEVRNARSAYENDADGVKDVAILRAQLGKELADWKQSGFLALPLEIVVKLKGNGLGWGGEYKKKKDFMHFEVYPDTVLQRQAPP